MERGEGEEKEIKQWYGEEKEACKSSRKKGPEETIIVLSSNFCHTTWQHPYNIFVLIYLKFKTNVNYWQQLACNSIMFNDYGYNCYFTHTGCLSVLEISWDLECTAANSSKQFSHTRLLFSYKVIVWVNKNHLWSQGLAGLPQWKLNVYICGHPSMVSPSPGDGIR